MKPPATRMVRTAGKAPATQTVRATYHATKTPRRGKRRGSHRLLVLLALAAGALWLFRGASGSGDATRSGRLRLLGDTAGASVGAAYRAVRDGVDAVRSTFDGAPTTIPATNTPAPGATAQGALHAAALPTPIVTTRPVPGSTATMPAMHAVPRTQTPHKSGHPSFASMPTPVRLQPPPSAALLANDYQVFETWNNCGPASLSMALSYFGIHQSQAALGQTLRPYQNQQGGNDDKDVTMEELAHEARSFGLLAYHRPSGSIALLKQLIAAGMPVIAETVLTRDDDIGHYRVVKGYDDGAGVVVQDDSMQGHDVRFAYADFDAMWKKYNYEYLVLVPRAKRQLAERILGRHLSARAAWQATVRMDRAALAADPSDVDSRFNLSVALYYTGDYRGSVAAFERVRDRLPARTLWYQLEPLEAYYALGDYQEVFALSDAVLSGGDRAYSQLYLLRGEIDLKQGNRQAARAEFRSAVLYNVHLQAALDALRAVS